MLCVCLCLTGCGKGTEKLPEATSQSETADAQTTEEQSSMTTETPTIPTKPKEPWEMMTEDSGLSVRLVNIDIPGEGDPIEIVQLTDIHFNTINDEDLAENNELVINSSKDLTWPKEGKAVENLQRGLAYGVTADQVVITGDAISYLSKGNIESMYKYIWEPYPDTLICAGNHDPLRSWNAAVDESATLDERISILEAAWKHDMYYTSKVLDERVMVIQMDNALRFDYGDPGFWECQVEPFKNDLALAREKGYTVLLFYHVPLCTRDVRDYNNVPLGNHGVAFNFYTKGIGNVNTKGASKEIYELITNNADLIAATFCGHRHGDYYTEIKAKNADGSDATIPQYVLAAMPYDKGHVIKITLS